MIWRGDMLGLIYHNIGPITQMSVLLCLNVKCKCTHFRSAKTYVRTPDLALSLRTHSKWVDIKFTRTCHFRLGTCLRTHSRWVKTGCTQLLTPAHTHLCRVLTSDGGAIKFPRFAHIRLKMLALKEVSTSEVSTRKKCLGLNEYS